MTITNVSLGTTNAPSMPPSGSSDPPPNLMPEPSGDPMSMMYVLMSKQRSTDMQSGKASVEHNDEMKKAELLKQEADFKKQEDDEKSAAAWGIFGKIASVIAIAISAVASVCTCGAASGLCAAACIISTMAFAEGQAQILTKLTGNPDVDKAFQVGSSIAAACCSGGAGIANLAATTAATVGQVMADVGQIAGAACTIGQQAMGCVDDPGMKEAAMALGIAGAVCNAAGSIGSAADTGVQAGAQVASATVAAVNGTVDVASGVAAIGESQNEADATDDAANAKQAQQAIDRLQDLTKWTVDALQETDKSHARALQTLAGAMQTQAQTLVIASSKV